MKGSKPLVFFLFICYVIALIGMSYFSKQDAFILNTSLYTLLFAAFLGMYKWKKHLTTTQLNGTAISLHLIVLFSTPMLSPDVYRFLWDGEIATQGIHPYAHLPKELIHESNFNFTTYLKEIYTQITDLSKENYSAYPTLKQVYFFITALFTENIFAAIVVMKTLVLTTQIVGFIYLKKLLKHHGIQQGKAYLLALNPFIIIELTGNLHFEGVMLSWLIIGLYFIFKKKYVSAGLFWAIAINIKLTPLLLLPFFFRYLGWKKAVKFYSATSVFTFLFLSVLLWPSVYSNFMQSIQLYFTNFEFNSSVYLLTNKIMQPIYGHDTVFITGPFLAKIALIGILVLAFTVKKENTKYLFRNLLIGYIGYLIFSSTVHPWYITIPLGLSLFTHSNVMIVWSYTIMLSYGFYAYSTSPYIHLLTFVEYVTLIGFLVYEYRKNLWLKIF